MEIKTGTGEYVHNNRLPIFKSTKDNFTLIAEKLGHIEELLEEIMKKISNNYTEDII